MKFVKVSLQVLMRARNNCKSCPWEFLNKLWLDVKYLGPEADLAWCVQIRLRCGGMQIHQQTYQIVFVLEIILKTLFVSRLRFVSFSMILFPLECLIMTKSDLTKKLLFQQDLFREQFPAYHSLSPSVATFFPGYLIPRQWQGLHCLCVYCTNNNFGLTCNKLFHWKWRNTFLLF